MSNEYTADCELDVCGLKCPLPILRTKKTLSGMSSGEVLHVLATDPAAVQDFLAFAEQTGNAMLMANEENGIYEFFLVRK